MEHDFTNLGRSNLASFGMGKEDENSLEDKREEKDPNEEISQQEAWRIIKSFFEEHGLVSQQVASYNHFLSTTIQEVVNESPVITVIPQRQYLPQEEEETKNLKYEFHLGKMATAKAPSITEGDEAVRKIGPQEARLRNLTYETELFMTITQRKKEVNDRTKQEKDIDEPVVFDNLSIARVPVMVRSNYCALHDLPDERRVKEYQECVHDQGGYFVIKGGEKVIVAQERMASNFVYVFKKKQPSKFSWTAEIRSSMEATNRPPNLFTVKMFSIKSAQTRSNQTGHFGQTIMASLPYVKQDIPIVILFRALNLRSDKSILEHICYDSNDKSMMEVMRPSLEEGFPIQNQEVALDFIGKRGNTVGAEKKERMKYAKDKLEKEMLPHVATTQNCEQKKAFFIGYMVHRLCNAALGRVGEDDRDHYGKKRLDMAGSLLGSLFRQLFRKFIEEAQKVIQRDVDNQKATNLRNAFKSKMITNGLKNALSTGNWGSSRTGQVLKTGVSQVLNRLTFASSLSHLRRLNTPLQKQGKLSKPRLLHNTHWGMVCPAETPEGQACGLVKNLTLMSKVSIGVYTKSIVEYCESWGTENLMELNPTSIQSNAKVFVNGSWIGIHHNPEELVENLRSFRRRLLISEEVSIVRDITNREIKLDFIPSYSI